MILADMHTHSEHSHDSECPVCDMCKSEIKNKVSIMAVTDHCDILFSKDIDVFTPIKNSYNDADEINKQFDSIDILKGIEVCETFWYPEETEKALNMLDYDVVIGSVHAVKYKNYTFPFSKINFSEMRIEEISEFMHAYFDDILTMLRKTDIDILAHLTNPLRYINGIYGIGFELKPYYGKISEILNYIIKHNIALEVNTSDLKKLRALTPDEKILTMYYNYGGRLITLGSDAHAAENAAYGFDFAIDTLKKIGFKNIYYYKKRKSIACEIE